MVSGSSKPQWREDERESGRSKNAADKLFRGIKPKTGKHDPAERDIRIVLAGMQGKAGPVSFAFHAGALMPGRAGAGACFRSVEVAADTDDQRPRR